VENFNPLIFNDYYFSYIKTRGNLVDFRNENSQNGIIALEHLLVFTVNDFIRARLQNNNFIIGSYEEFDIYRIGASTPTTHKVLMHWR
jgi:hypothetical protein